MCDDGETTTCGSNEATSTTNHENENPYHPQGRINTPTITLAEEENSTTTTTTTTAFAIGDAVEIYGPGAYFAIPATVTGIITRGSSSRTSLYKYNLLRGITQLKLNNVEMQFVHSYRVYDIGTEASCNVRNVLRNDAVVVMVPCTVISSNMEESSSNGDGGEIVYRVLTKKLEGVEDVERVLSLPRMRVQRYLDKPVER